MFAVVRAEDKDGNVFPKSVLDWFEQAEDGSYRHNVVIQGSHGKVGITYGYCAGSKKVSGCIWVFDQAGAKHASLDETSFANAYLQEVQEDHYAGVELVKVSARLNLAALVMARKCEVEDPFPHWVTPEEEEKVQRLLLG